MASEPTRVAALDGLRGLLAVVVLVWHVADPLGVGWLLIPAKVAVGLFFLLSGYALTRGWDNRIPAFFVRRFVRLWPVYAVCVVAGVLVSGKAPAWSEFFWYPLVDPNDKGLVNPPVWTLYLEVWTMPLMPLIVWSRGAILTRAMPLALVFLAASLFNPVLQAPVFFIAGASLAHLDFRSRFLESAIPQWLGRISYSLYLSHALVLIAAVRVFGPWGGVAATPVAFLIGWLIWRLVERPSISLSRRAGRAVNEALAAGRQKPSVEAPLA